MPSGGRAVGWQGTWILGATITELDLNLAPAISAGEIGGVVGY